jgi:hypothetical protein
MQNKLLDKFVVLSCVISRFTTCQGNGNPYVGKIKLFKFQIFK